MIDLDPKITRLDYLDNFDKDIFDNANGALF